MTSTPRSPKSGYSKPRTPPATPPHPSKRRRRNRTWASIVDALALANGIEEDAHRIAQRQKQIDYGKNTIAYDKFSAAWPRHRRQKGHPMTPLAKQRCSKRSFGGQLTSWKKKVYEFAAKLEMADTVDGGENWRASNGEEGQEGGDSKQGGACSSRQDGKRSARGKSEGGSDKIGAGRNGFGKVEGVVAAGGSKVVDAEGELGAECELGADDELLSDMDDIELDDQGNVIQAESDKGPASPEGGSVERKVEGSPSSIFDAY